jgi:hypothetical protein
LHRSHKAHLGLEFLTHSSELVNRRERKPKASLIPPGGLMHNSRSRRWQYEPSRLRTSFLFTACAILAASLALSSSAFRARRVGSAGPLDGRFMPLGQDYLPELGRLYGKAWVEGAKRLESGQSVPTALRTVRSLWDTGRVQLFDRMITPQFARIIAENRAPSQYTFDERLALAKAWRGFAAGLETPRK